MKGKFSWTEETGEALCVLQDKIGTYCGKAKCHESDRDLMSEKTGCTIALMRAKIQLLQSRLKDLKLELKGLKRFYYTINKSKYFNPKNYEVRRLLSHIEMLKADVHTTKNLIDLQKQELSDYLSTKKEFQENIRRFRKMDENK